MTTTAEGDQQVRIGKSVRAVPGRPGSCVVTALLAGALMLSGCGTEVDNIVVGEGIGWPGPHHDARNSNTSPVTGSRSLDLDWSRSLGAPVRQPISLGSDGQLFVTTDLPGVPGIPDEDVAYSPDGAPVPGPEPVSEDAGSAEASEPPMGCNIFAFQMQTGRKRFCNPLGPHAIASPSLLDGGNNVYVGDDSGVSSHNYLGQPRWRVPVAGVPVSLQFTGDGRLLTITQSGQLDVLDRQTGAQVVSTQQLLGHPDFLERPGLEWPEPETGLNDCASGGPHCPVANVSALDLETGLFYVTVWEPGTGAASMLAMRYGDGSVEQEWRLDGLRGGSATSPALSADGSTVYVGDNSGRLLAVDTADGRTKWTHELNWTPTGGISVSEDGMVLPAGNEGHLLGLRDNGDSVERVWERKDLALRGTPVQTEGHTGYTPAAIGDGLQLITFDTSTGDTIDSDALPGAAHDTTTTGTSVGPAGEVVVTTKRGKIFTFKGQS